MTTRVALHVAVTVLLTLSTGCGSGGGTTSSGDNPSRSPSPTASSAPAASEPSSSVEDDTGEYFVTSDTDALNAAAVTAQEAGAAVVQPKAIRRCNRVRTDGFEGWSECWLGLVDPYRDALRGVAKQMRTAADQDLVAACRQGLRAAADDVEALADRIDTLEEGFRSSEPAAQRRTKRAYSSTVQEVGSGLLPPFQRLTDVCYSPEDLARFRADASAGATPTP